MVAILCKKSKSNLTLYLASKLPLIIWPLTNTLHVKINGQILQWSTLRSSLKDWKVLRTKNLIECIPLVILTDYCESYTEEFAFISRRWNIAISFLKHWNLWFMVIRECSWLYIFMQGYKIDVIFSNVL